MLALCGVILSPYLQDLTMRVGFKPYLSMVCLAVLPLVFLASGHVFRALESTAGKAWLGFAVFAIFSIPFSYWPGGSVELMRSFLLLNLSLFVFMCTFATSYKYCRWIVNTNVMTGVLALISCVVFGDYDGGRLVIPGSYFLLNSNDLALVLLIDLGYFYYLVLRPNIVGRVLGLTGMAGCLYFLLKTGSRGGFLALGVFVAVLFVFSVNKFLWAAVAVPVVALTLIVMPASLLHRLTLILVDPGLSQAESGSDVGAIESQQERQALVKKALHYTLVRPLTGVGPGQFINAVWADEHKEGKHPPALGTHNTYLEVSSECGLPALFCYLTVVLGGLFTNYRGLKRLRQRPDRADAARLTYCLLAITAGFAASIFFHHLTYTMYLPLLSGITACVNAATSEPKAGAPPPRAI
jgi:putative inorganic carbon (HCO3(-)) transporter